VIVHDAELGVPVSETVKLFVGLRIMMLDDWVPKTTIVPEPLVVPAPSLTVTVTVPERELSTAAALAEGVAAAFKAAWVVVSSSSI
jgi:hypothetical protein